MRQRDKKILKDLDAKLYEAIDAMQQYILDRSTAEAGIALTSEAISHLRWQMGILIEGDRTVYKDPPPCTCPTCAVDGCQPEWGYDWMNGEDIDQ